MSDQEPIPFVGFAFDDGHEPSREEIRNMIVGKIENLEPADPIVFDGGVHITHWGHPQLQERIYRWARSTFSADSDDYTYLKQIMLKMEHEHEENQDAVAELLKYPSESWRDSCDDLISEARKEAADTLFMLFQEAEILGFDLLDACEEKFGINMERQWAKNPDGTYSHIKASANGDDGSHE